MRIIKQHDERDCGAACLSMIASHFGLKHPISKYRELTNYISDWTGKTQWSEEDKNTIYAMQEDVNHIIEMLQKEDGFTPAF